MALSVTYTTFDDEIVYENRNGTPSYYVPDTLGSTAQLWNSSGVKTDEWTYWPFGEMRTRTGSTNTPFTFIGTLGYYFEILGSIIYIRARSLRQALARWQTVDPMWPRQPSYAYARLSPSLFIDPSGLKSCSDCYATCLYFGATLLGICLAAAATLLALALIGCGVICGESLGTACSTCLAMAARQFARALIACGIAAIAYAKCCEEMECCCETGYVASSSCCGPVVVLLCGAGFGYNCTK